MLSLNINEMRVALCTAIMLIFFDSESKIVNLECIHDLAELFGADAPIRIYDKQLLCREENNPASWESIIRPALEQYLR